MVAVLRRHKSAREAASSTSSSAETSSCPVELERVPTSDLERSKSEASSVIMVSSRDCNAAGVSNSSPGAALPLPRLEELLKKLGVCQLVPELESP